jgi:DNA-binding IclR family transcriptional regulator
MVGAPHAPVKPSTRAGGAQAKAVKKAKATGVRAVERAIDILDAFSVERPALTITELTKSVRLNRPTLYRMLATLMQRGLVQLSGDPPRYRLDYGAARFAEAWSRSIEIGQTALPFLEPLLQRFDETVALYLRRNNTRICAVELPSRQPLSYSRGLGHAESLRRGASGIAILAFLRREEFEAILAEDHDPAAANALRRTLAQARARGYALSRDHLIVGAQAIAAPVFDRTQAAVAALGLFGPAARFTPERITECAEAVQRAAASLSKALGYVAPSVIRDEG